MSYYLQLMDKNRLILTEEARTCRIAEGLAIEHILVNDDDDGISKLMQQYLQEQPAAEYSPILSEDHRRICSECRLPKSRECYTKNKNKADGQDARCRDCKKVIARIRYLEKKR